MGDPARDSDYLVYHLARHYAGVFCYGDSAAYRAGMIGRFIRPNLVKPKHCVQTVIQRMYGFCIQARNLFAETLLVNSQELTHIDDRVPV